MKFESGKVTLSAILTATLVAGMIFAGNINTSSAVDSRPYCHANSADFYIYHDNPAWDAHLLNNGTALSGHELDFFTYEGNEDCVKSTPTPTPVVTQSPTPTATPSSTPSASATPSATPVVTPTATPTQTSVATDTPRETQTPVSTPNGDVCTNIDGIQTSLPGSNWYFVGEGSTICREFEYGGPNSSTGNSNGQVLGASTMAATGSFAETIYQAIMGLGGLITAKGIKKAKTSKKK